VIAFGCSLTGTLYGVTYPAGSLLTIDPLTGQGTSVAIVDVTAITDIAARPEDGVMFAVSTWTDAIYTLDLSTGETTLVGPHGGVSYMVGLAFSPGEEPVQPPVAVPGGPYQAECAGPTTELAVDGKRILRPGRSAAGVRLDHRLSRWPFR